jgi:exopolyphosphatase/guanosine-5'-triphosphate,3'-diphosphate pyrophosphatase
VDKLLALSVDDIVRKYHLPYPDAESVGPALLAYVRLAQAFGVKKLLVAGATLRDGLLAEMAGKSWTDEFTRQIVHSATELARRYNVDLAHSLHVMGLAKTIFTAMQGEHRLSPRYELILTIAAILHEVGLFISNRSHHKHSMYVIRNSDVFGLGASEMLLTSLVARYHRRAAPKPTHDTYSVLDRDKRIAVAKLAAILRVADALDRSHAQRIKDIEVSVEQGRLVIVVRGVSDLTIEHLGLKQKGPMFEDVYGLSVILRPATREGVLSR